LVIAALRLYRGNSSEAVGITDITDLAQVKRGSFYYYFPTKKSLTLAVLEGEWDLHRQQIFEPAFQTNQPMASQFEEFARRLHRFHQGMRREAGGAVGCPFANLGYELAVQDDEVRVKVAEILDRVAGYFENALVRGLGNHELVRVDPNQAAEDDLIYVEGLLAVSKIRDDLALIANMASGFPHLRA
jgi:TetR/AcrR family transcriptional repressor of nem operon